MATTTVRRARTATGTAVLTALVLVIAFGNPAFIDWVHRHAPHDAWGFFLKQLAWPAWTFSSDESIRGVLADDLRAILVVILTGVFVAVLVGAPERTSRLFFDTWGGYIFAGAAAGLLAAFIRSNPSVLGAFDWAASGAVYGLFVGWIVGVIVTFSHR